MAQNNHGSPPAFSSPFIILCVSLLLIPQTTGYTSPFRFPETQSTVVPDPSTFFSQNLLSTPLPTNSFFQNYALKNGNQPEYFHPYSINSSSSSLSISYPSVSSTSNVVSQLFIPDLTISASQTTTDHHVISSFNDLSVTLDFPSSNLHFFLVRGSPYITCSVSSPTAITISTVHAILSSSSSPSNTKYKLNLNNNQTWIIYTSSPIIELAKPTPTSINFGEFSGIIRIAILPNSDPKSEAILDQFSPSYPTSGEAVFVKQFTLQYKWEKAGEGDLLMLAHPLHLSLLSRANILQDFGYKSIDGDLVGVVGDSWELNSQQVPITWNSIRGVKPESFPEIISSLLLDVQALTSTPIKTPSSYFYGKLIARAARLALIAEEVGHRDVIPTIQKYLAAAIEPWLDGTLSDNGFLYEGKWGGLVTKLGSTDPGADFGFGIYNDHHFHLGYFLYGISVLAKIDPVWGSKYKPQAYSLAEDFINLRRKESDSKYYPRLRNFDLYKLHSWAGGLTEFGDGRNQESTSEAVNAYYSAALLGLAYGDTELVATASTLTALEIQAAQMWWHVNNNKTIYGEAFKSGNKIVGIVWATKRDAGLWFAAPEAREIRVGIQVLPISPVTEALFSDQGFARELVEWALPSLSKEGVADAWKGFVYALQGIYDQVGGLEKIKGLKGFDDGNSLSNMLWWIHSRN